MNISQRSTTIVLILLASAVTGLYFIPFLNNFFTYDDFALIEHVHQGPIKVLQGYNYTLRFVTNSLWIPLYALSGLDPAGYNLFSMLLWLLNAILLYIFLRRLLHEPLLAAAAGFIFAGSAIGADAVFWRAANGTLLDLTFYLLTLYLYTAFRQTGRPAYWRLSLVTFCLAVFTKEESASLPLVVILLEWLYFGGISDLKGISRRCISYWALTASSLLINYIIIYKILQVQSELANLSKFRPLHSLFSGWTVFFLDLDGKLKIGDPRIYVTALLIVAALVLVKDRRLLLLGLGWIFLTFLPQSLSNLSQFEPRFIFSSLSRHLYLPSAGAAIAYTAILAELKDRFSPKVAMVSAALFLTLFLSHNYNQLQKRGEEWRDDGEPTKLFLESIRKVVPEFPPNTHIYVNNGPTGRAYIQQSLRAFYKNSTIYWIVDPATYRRKPGETALIIDCYWPQQGDVLFSIRPL